MMDQALQHYYKQNRTHQMNTYGFGTSYKSGRTEATGGGAAYGFHAFAAFNSARSRVHFLKTLGKTMKATKKRSDGSKRGWEIRRANA